jgi:hypothetical protein
MLPPRGTQTLKEMFTQPIPTVGTLDGNGASDRDQPYPLAGWRARVAAPYPFSTRQFARLLILRSRVDGGLFGSDDLSAVSRPAEADLLCCPAA